MKHRFYTSTQGLTRQEVLDELVEFYAQFKEVNRVLDINQTNAISSAKRDGELGDSWEKPKESGGN